MQNVFQTSVWLLSHSHKRKFYSVIHKYEDIASLSKNCIKHIKYVNLSSESSRERKLKTCRIRFPRSYRLLSTIVRFKFSWQHVESMPCYSYEHRVATSLHKNVGSKRWGCSALYGETLLNSVFKVQNKTLTYNFWYKDLWNRSIVRSGATFEINRVRNKPFLSSAAQPQPLNRLPLFLWWLYSGSAPRTTISPYRRGSKNDKVF